MNRRQSKLLPKHAFNFNFEKFIIPNQKVDFKIKLNDEFVSQSETDNWKEKLTDEFKRLRYALQFLMLAYRIIEDDNGKISSILKIVKLKIMNS